MPGQLKVDIRWLISRDMPEVLVVEQACFEFPWSSEEFLKCLRQRNCVGMVSEHRHSIVGFMVYELFKGEIQILNLAVYPDHQRCGVGTQMIDRLKDKLSQQRRTQMFAEVRERNVDAQLFFRVMGFQATELIRGYYEDCYVMRYTVDRESRLAWSNPFHPRNRISEHIDT